MRSLARCGATELASRDQTLPVRASLTTAQKTYPPRSTDSGSRTAQASEAAAAASMALPPLLRISAPTRAAAAGPVATAPRLQTISLPSRIWIEARLDGDSWEESITPWSTSKKDKIKKPVGVESHSPPVIECWSGW